MKDGNNHQSTKLSTRLAEISTELVEISSLLKDAELAQNSQSISHTGSEIKSKTKSKHKEPVDPNAPKKPLSSYFRFYQDVQKRLVAENPTLQYNDIARLAGAKWKELDEAEKQIYSDRFAFENKLYKEELAEYEKAKVNSQNGRSDLNTHIEQEIKQSSQQHINEVLTSSEHEKLSHSHHQIMHEKPQNEINKPSIDQHLKDIVHPVIHEKHSKHENLDQEVEQRIKKKKARKNKKAKKQIEE